MAIYTNLPVYKASYSLLLEVSQMQKDLPKDSRYTIGMELRGKIMYIIILIYRANRNRRKTEIIMEMHETLLEVQVYMRLLCDMKHISERRYAMLAEQTSAIGKQMTAWEKSELRKQGDGGQTD